MLNAPVKGTTVLVGDNKSMITDTSLPYSTLKKHVYANYYHYVRDAVASRIAFIIHCDPKYNLVDMGTKSLNGSIHQLLLQDQQFPPVMTVREYKTDLKIQSTGVTAGIS
eukprot:1093480-Ditylum_brightwellii.AAC.1